MIRNLLLISILIVLYGCSSKEFGKSIPIDNITPVLHLKKYPVNYLDKYIKIQGRVVEDSESKLWFTLQDNHIIIMIDTGNIKGLPEIKGKDVIVIGKLGNNKNGYCLFARWLKIL